jgi:transcriptional regulator with XRE-family HTH domain
MDEASITSEQCRAARALLAWSQDDLSVKARISKTTLALFEIGERNPYARTLAALRRSLERAGVVFIDQNGGGPGVRLKRKAKR